MRKKILVMITAIALTVAMMPVMVFAGTSSDKVTVKFSAGVPGAFDMVDEAITATGDLAEKYFPEIAGNEPEGVSFADVLVAAHIKKYGEDEDILKKHLDISNGSWGTQMNKQFDHTIVGFYYRNNSSLPGSVSDTVKDGDILFAGAYGDYNYTDLFTSFNKKDYRVKAGKKFSLSVSSDNWGIKVIPYEVKIATVNKSTGKFTDVQTKYADGIASVTFKNVGIYYVTADGTIKYESQDWETGDVVEKSGACVGALARVTVGLDKVKIIKKNVKKKQVAIKWNKVIGAKKYQVYRAAKKNGNYKKVSTTAKTSFTNKKLKKNTKYFYKVRAIATVGGKTYKGAFSSVSVVKTKK